MINKDELISQNFEWLNEKAYFFCRNKSDASDLVSRVTLKFLESNTFIPGNDVTQSFKDYIFFMIKYDFVQSKEK